MTVMNAIASLSGYQITEELYTGRLHPGLSRYAY